MKRLFAVLAMCLLFVGTVHAQMTDFVDGAPVYDARDNEVFVISNKLDFADLATYPDGGVTSASVVQALNIPAGMIVTDVGWRVDTAYNLSSCSGYTMVVGDGADPNGWLTGVYFATSASGVSRANGAYSVVAADGDTGKHYSAADTIDITVQTIAAATIGTWLDQDPLSFVTNFVVDVWAEGVMAPTQKNYGTLR